ncbi:MAG TPA: ATP cone domain-containing protein [Methanomassiliicoccales archaeon]
MKVTKRSGQIEEFDRSKTKVAVLRAGASSDEAEDIIDRLLPRLYDGITTEEVYRHIRTMLNARTAARFGLKKAILALGPDGRNFETLIFRLFQAMGYEARVRETIQGRCVTHEIDVMMEKDHQRFMVECKFHNSLSLKCSIQTALYTYGRFLDVDGSSDLQCPFLVTNTRFSSDVVKYADCVCMKLIGWRQPEKGGLEELIERYHLFPVTMLDLKRSEIRTLLEKDMVLVRDILDKREDVVRSLGRDSAQRAIEAAEELGL